MGLDITAYKKLKKVEKPQLDKNGYPVNWESEWLPGESMKWSESLWPGRGKGVDPDTVYTFEQEYSFSAGSSSSYNWWRETLQEFASESFFDELLDFSDSEGVIGCVVSKKLAKAFEEQEEAAVAFAGTLIDGGNWLDLYMDWKMAFEMAADNGAVVFN